MKLTKKLETEILKVYNAYWDSYFKGDMRAFASLLHENVQLIGSSENEVFSNKRSAMKFYKATAGQVAGKAGVRNRKITMQPVGNNVLVIEQSDFYVLIDNEWNFYGNGRISTLLQKTETGWKIIHEHGSLPDSKAGEGEQVNTERIKAENRQLREAVKRRTIELEMKNNELEIETALERVRVVAMGMRNPQDMLDVCKTISLQLESLGVKEIRNVQTAIFYEKRSTYMNYEYYAKHKETFITETIYNNNKIHKAFAVKMLKGKGESFITHIKGKKVKEWIAYQKTTNVFIDKYLNKASSLNYYWFSLGPVALGISTYHPLTEEEINLFKRFLKVFELAYRRYLDIEKAEAQAKEAQIELALERVRARTMAMQKSDELREAVHIIYEQLQHLNFEAQACNIIIIDKDSGDMQFWVSGFSQEIYPESYHIPRLNHHYHEDQLTAWKKGVKYAVFEYSGKEKKSFDKMFFSKTDFKNVPEQAKQFMMGLKSVKLSTAFFSYGSLQVLGPEEISEGKIKILQRFAKVFEQTYTRFLDLQKAEAQAREAKIEAALERVRSRTMGMRYSRDLQEVVSVLYEQLDTLGLADWGCSIMIFDENANRIENWVAESTGSDLNCYIVEGQEHPVYDKLWQYWKQQGPPMTLHHTDEVKWDFDNYWLYETGF